MPAPPRPDVDSLEGLTAAIVVGQESMAASARSTLGTATDITGHLRVLFAHLTPICIEHHRAGLAHADHIIDLGPGAGSAGGHVLAACWPREFLDSGTLSARYLAQVL